MKNAAPLPSRHLEVADLASARGGRQVFAGISLSAGPGEAVVLRGPNGAGKTTLLLCLAGLLRPSAGTLDWRGRDPEARPGADLHFLGHANAIKPDLAVAENLAFWAKVNGGDPDLIAPALAAAGLAHAATLEAGYLSAGQTRRLAICRLLVAARPIWLLDEPSAALDRQGETWLAGLIAAHLDAGGLVIAATHADLGIAGTGRLKTLDLGAAS